MTEAVLELRDVTYRRDGIQIIRGVSCTVNRGEHWALLGPNGAGCSRQATEGGVRNSAASACVPKSGWRREPTWPRGLLHADPAPEAFRYDAATGRCGVIDWSSAHHGPLLYDLASAVMYLGGPSRAAAMTAAYLSADPLTAGAGADDLPVMLRFRWAVQADYFAWRISTGDLTGIAGPEENEKGLEDARRALLLGDGTE
jgi:Ser/Thr protein kinase RdoA (MazF antagonist)